MERLYSNGEVNRAGKIVSCPEESYRTLSEEVLSKAWKFFFHWRDIHGYPLASVTRTLKQRATNIDSGAIVAQRLKRSTSIISKLMRSEEEQERMALSRMQDIAGCRAVLSSIDQVYELKRYYERYAERYPDRGPELIATATKDYIWKTKPDTGYRGVHFVMKYRTEKESAKHLSGLRVEIQIRSRLQHAWAMAVETASAKTKQALKSGRGREPWRHFFRLMGTVIALKEDMPIVPATDEADVYHQVRVLSRELKVISLFTGMQNALHVLGGVEHPESKDDFYLLELDSRNGSVRYDVFSPNEFAEAAGQYASLERRTENNEDIHVVLVNVGDFRSLRLAYPSYFLDATEFIELIREACGMGGTRLTRRRRSR